MPKIKVLNKEYESFVDCNGNEFTRFSHKLNAGTHNALIEEFKKEGWKLSATPIVEHKGIEYIGCFFRRKALKE